MKPQTANDFVMTRRGLREHVIKKRMTLDDYGMYNWILQGADPKSGIYYSNSTILSSELSIDRRQAQHSLYKLRERQYIHYDDTRGVRGPHEIYINLYPVQTEKNDRGSSMTWYPNIWDDGGNFIGRQRHEAQMILMSVYAKRTISIGIPIGIPAVVSISGGALSMDFELHFTAHFEEYQKTVEELTSYPCFCKWLVHFQPDFQMHFQRTLDEVTYKIHIQDTKDKSVGNSKKALLLKKQEADASLLSEEEEKTGKTNPSIELTEEKGPTAEDKRLIALACDKLKGNGKGFNPFQFVQKTINARIPHDVTLAVLQSMGKNQADIKNFWGYALKVLREEYREYNYARELERHYKFKKENIGGILKSLKIIGEKEETHVE